MDDCRRSEELKLPSHVGIFMKDDLLSAAYHEIFLC